VYLQTVPYQGVLRGGGEAIENTTFAVTPGTSISVTVGDGGALPSNTDTCLVGSGGSSSFDTITVSDGSGSDCTFSLMKIINYPPLNLFLMYRC